MSAAKPDVIHPVNVGFADDVDYRTYRIHNRSQKYNEKMTARTAKLANRTKAIMKPYKFEASYPVTILFFLWQSKRPYDSNGVSEWVAMWLLPFFIAKSLAATLTI